LTHIVKDSDAQTLRAEAEGNICLSMRQYLSIYIKRKRYGKKVSSKDKGERETETEQGIKERKNEKHQVN
jgi:hypothetical protein